MDPRNVRTMALALLFVLMAGCAKPGTDTGDEGGITMSVTLDRTTIGPDDVVTATATVTNRGSDAYPYEHRGCPPERIDVVAVVGGKEVRLYEYGAEGMFGTCAVHTVTLAPGDSVRETANWNGRTEQAADQAPHEGARVTPGTYTILASLAQIEGKVAVQGAGKLAVT